MKDSFSPFLLSLCHVGHLIKFKLEQDNCVGRHEADGNQDRVEVELKAVQRFHRSLDRQLTLETLELKLFLFLQLTEVRYLRK